MNEVELRRQLTIKSRILVNCEKTIHEKDVRIHELETELAQTKSDMENMLLAIRGGKFHWYTATLAIFQLFNKLDSMLISSIKRLDTVAPFRTHLKGDWINGEHETKIQKD